MVSHPEESRPLPPARKSDKPRKISQRERRRQAFQYWVTVFLAVVFIGSSVGVLILARPSSSGNAAQSESEVSELRLANAREQALKNPKDPQWPYEAAEILVNKGDTAGAVKEYKAALSIEPGYLPALQGLSSLLVSEKRYAEAQAVLAEGLLAEKRDIEQLNKERKPDEPEVQPDQNLRFLLFDVDMALGPAQQTEARAMLAQALAINPTTYSNMLKGWALKTAFESRDKKTALQGLQIAIDEARRAKEPAAVADLEKTMGTVVTLNLTPPSVLPSGAPLAPPSGEAVPPPSATPTTP